MRIIPITSAIGYETQIEIIETFSREGRPLRCVFLGLAATYYMLNFVSYLKRAGIETAAYIGKHVPEDGIGMELREIVSIVSLDHQTTFDGVKKNFAKDNSIDILFVDNDADGIWAALKSLGLIHGRAARDIADIEQNIKRKNLSCMGRFLWKAVYFYISPAIWFEREGRLKELIDFLNQGEPDNKFHRKIEDCYRQAVINARKIPLVCDKDGNWMADMRELPPNAPYLRSILLKRLREKNSSHIPLQILLRSSCGAEKVRIYNHSVMRLSLFKDREIPYITMSIRDSRLEIMRAELKSSRELK